MGYSKKFKYRKPTKSISGVIPLAVVIKPMKCPHGTCLYCPTLDVPQSYTPKSPAIMRAAQLNYDAFKQTKARLKAFQIMKHSTDKIELIIMGGTFLAYPKQYQYEFIKACYDALNDKKSRDLKEAKKFNEKAKHRVVALCIETRPDYCSDRDIRRMLEFGCTRVELGVQAVDNRIYRKVCRGHGVKEVVDATKRLKNAGFKIGYHIMPGLPGSNLKKDVKLFKKLFSDENFKPDQLKIYPTQVIKGSELEKLYWNGKYKPYDKEQLIRLLIEFKKIVPRYCRIMRVMREIPPDFLVAGTIRIDLRREIQKRFSKCKCIRCREIGFALLNKKEVKKGLKLKITKYRASKGKEFFVEFVNRQDIIFGLIRLRIPDKSRVMFVRELHIYGPALRLGKKLMKTAEKIARKYRCKRIIVISGVGVREYYKELGYKFKDPYMVKP
ncbi:MAG: tRNA uridine(34) 5-carboxymethylaminomethyl modification radical SAM/GNAT enzyme Elp3 [archaeon]|nr:MAG: tRNA uridine(34) 5-carboxymethylaminomethyl modification radical SAM/GNAT enzyme Elp3 [archaeon]